MESSLDIPHPTDVNLRSVSQLGWALAVGVCLQGCSSACGEEERGDPTASKPAVVATWYEVVSHRAGPEVTDLVMRNKIAGSGLPWKVRDRATGIELVLVMPGEFLMGSPESEIGREKDEGPQHEVRLTRGFYLGATEVSQAQWRRLMGPTESFFEGDSLPIDPSWNDVNTFLTRASAAVSVVEQEHLRLPTEAEWEYAARAGTTTPFSLDGAIDPTRVNFNDGLVKSAVVVDGKFEVEWVTPPSPECLMATAPVGALPPNPWGVHEMHGNVWEWTADRYSADGFAEGESIVSDPFEAASGDQLLSLRGGSWYDGVGDCRSAARDGGSPGARSNRIGFRVARSL